MRQQERKHENAREAVHPQKLSESYGIADESQSRANHDLESQQSEGKKGQGHADPNCDRISGLGKVRDGECERQDCHQGKNRDRRGASPT